MTGLVDRDRERALYIWTDNWPCIYGHITGPVDLDQ